MAKNYYAILGVLPDATPEDIRGAYKKRAKELHPDHYGENSSPFLEVQEAYGVLSDPGHRRDYDRSLRKHRTYAEAMNPSEVEFYQCFSCMGRGALFKDVPVLVEFAPGIRDGYQKAISLRHLGIRDVYVTLLFRIRGTAPIEDL